MICLLSSLWKILGRTMFISDKMTLETKGSETEIPTFN
jgi:hypothetical protein